MANTQTREEWLAERRSGIGGSDAAAILGISPWSTPVDVWLDKTGRAGPKPETEAMRIGTELEDFVARRYCENTGRAVQRYNRMVHRGCLLGNFDRLVVPDGEKVASHKGEIRTDTLLECKTASVEWPDGDVPLYYQTQVQHYMGLAPEIAHADVAALFLTRKHFEVFRVERDDAVIAAMSARLTAWWDEFVVGDKMPPPTNEADCKLLWARSNPGKTVEATAEIKGKIAEYAAAKSREMEAKDDAVETMNSICAALGDAEVIVDAGGKALVTWKSARDSAKTDWEAVARSLASPEAVREAAARFTNVVPGSRRFLVKATLDELVA